VPLSPAGVPRIITSAGSTSTPEDCSGQQRSDVTVGDQPE
jgi:hypothetical protein